MEKNIITITIEITDKEILEILNLLNENDEYLLGFYKEMFTDLIEEPYVKVTDVKVKKV